MCCNKSKDKKIFDIEKNPVSTTKLKSVKDEDNITFREDCSLSLPKGSQSPHLQGSLKLQNPSEYNENFKSEVNYLKNSEMISIGNSDTTPQINFNQGNPLDLDDFENHLEFKLKSFSNIDLKTGPQNNQNQE